MNMHRLGNMILAACIVALVTPSIGAAQKGGAHETLKQYVADLNKHPENLELREKVIKHVQGMKQKPSVPEEFERLMSRGNAYLKMATDAAGYTKAVNEFVAAVALAPWVSDGYENLATAQEKASQYADAIQNLNFALLADPNAKNAREIRNRIYELEVFAEQANQKLKAAPAVPPPAPPVTAKTVPSAPKKTRAEKPEKKTSLKAFVGNWVFKDVAPRGGEEITTAAFTITMNRAGELAATAPRRSTGAIGSVTAFEVSGDDIRLQVTWKLATIPTYWKTEDYDVTLSDDEKTLTGSYKIKSSGSREFAEDKTLFKQ